MAKYSTYKMPDGSRRRFLAENAKLMRLVDKGNKIDQKIKSLKSQLSEVTEELVDAAKLRKSASDSKTVHIDSAAIRASISFAETISYNSAKLEPVREILGKDEFTRLFLTKTVHSPRRALELFMQQEPDDGIRAAQDAIGKAVVVKPRKPTLKFVQLDRND